MTLAGLEVSDIAGLLGVGLMLFAYAASAITVRVLSRTDSTQSMVFWLLTLMALGSAALAWPDWVPVRREHWGWIAGVGIIGMAGQYAITEAFRHGEASVIAPLEYTALAWGLAFDALLWGVLPDRVTWIGAAIIIASGLYLMRHEREAVRLGGREDGLVLQFVQGISKLRVAGGEARMFGLWAEIFAQRRSALVRANGMKPPANPQPCPA